MITHAPATDPRVDPTRDAVLIGGLLPGVDAKLKLIVRWWLYSQGNDQALSHWDGALVEGDTEDTLIDGTPVLAGPFVEVR